MGNKAKGDIVKMLGEAMRVEHVSIPRFWPSEVTEDRATARLTSSERMHPRYSTGR